MLSKLKKIIESRPVAFATSDEQGNPNLIAVACCKVVGKSQILVTDNFMKKTVKNLRTNSSVALMFWDKKERFGYQLKGSAKYLISGKWAKEVKKMKENKGLPAKAAVLVTIKKIIPLC
jgi:hypothetical protein